MRAYVRPVRRADQPYFIFIDINAPRELDGDWQADVQWWMNRMPAPTAKEPEVFNAMYITNFSPHFDGDDVSGGGAWLVVWLRYARPYHAGNDFQPALVQALNTYGRVPGFAEDGTLLP